MDTFSYVVENLMLGNQYMFQVNNKDGRHQISKLLTMYTFSYVVEDLVPVNQYMFQVNNKDGTPRSPSY